MHGRKLLDVHLDLFDGGAPAAGGAAAGAAAGAADGAAAEGASQRDASPPAGKGGTSKPVIYGKQKLPEADGAADGAAGKPEEAKPPEQPEQSPEDRRKAWRALVEGEYKDLFTEDTQAIINKRFRETEELRTQLDQSLSLIDILAQRYNVEGGNIPKLIKAVEEDDAYWRQAAEDAGMDVEQYKHVRRLERENAELLRRQKELVGKQRANEQVRLWASEAEEVRKAYPGFNLKAEIQDQQFASMLRAGVPMQHAYEVLHMEEIKAGIAATQARETESRVVSGIRAKGSRPAENGASAQSAFVVKDDVSRLTKKDRAEIARRARMGEIISF